MKIGIIAAMDEELEDLKEFLGDTKEENISRFQFFTGNAPRHTVVLSKCGIGKVNAAVGTTLLIDRYQPDVIINTGVAGGLYDTMQVGDLVISTDVKHHDVDATVFNYEYGQIPQMPASYDADPGLINLAGKACSEISRKHSVFKGTIMSGDSFIHNDRQISKLKKRFPHVLAVEMESASIGQSCFLFSVPFIVIRSISDIVTAEGSHVDYDTFVHHASKISASLVKELIHLIK